MMISIKESRKARTASGVGNNMARRKETELYIPRIEIYHPDEGIITLEDILIDVDVRMDASGDYTRDHFRGHQEYYLEQGKCIVSLPVLIACLKAAAPMAKNGDVTAKRFLESVKLSGITSTIVDPGTHSVSHFDGLGLPQYMGIPPEWNGEADELKKPHYLQEVWEPSLQALTGLENPDELQQISPGKADYMLSLFFDRRVAWFSLDKKRTYVGFTDFNISPFSADRKGQLWNARGVQRGGK